MSPNKPTPPARSALRPGLRALLVLTVLAGLLGMHGLSAMGPLPTGHHAEPHAAQPSHASQQHLCHGKDGPTGPHGGHADQTCASGALPGSVTAPALAVAVPNGIDTAVRPLTLSRSEPVGGRAPPSLAELQLLRI